jgi:predicted ATP-grasp superfamily ATP-dependent carboligase
MYERKEAEAMTVIVTDAHYRMSVALIRDLGEAGARVVACEKSGFASPPGFFSKWASETRTLPAEDYTAALLALCGEYRQKDGEKPALLPVGAGTLALAAQNRERFAAVCSFAVPTAEQLALFNDKAAVAKLAAFVGVPTPESFERREGEQAAAFFARVPLPCVVKPACGEKFGLKAEARYVIAKTPEALQAAWERFSALTGEDPVVQEYLTGGGFGCSVLAKNGRVLASLCHRRVREYPVTGGPSSCCESITDADMLAAVSRLVSESGYTGLAMFEFKAGADGKKRLLEVNPRVWGTYPLTRAAGTNFASLWLALSAGKPLPAYLPPKKVRMVFYPSDLAAGLGYLRRGRPGRFFGAAWDLLRPGVKNGLAERGDPGPWRAYLKNLRKRP